MLPIIDFLMTGFDCCFAAFETSVFFADIVCWVRGRPNRVERRDARKLGQERVPLDKWSIAFLVLTGIVVLSTILIFWLARKP